MRRSAPDEFSDELSLLQAIADDPADPVRRKRWRAWLVAHDDPRIELSALHASRKTNGTLTKVEAKREASLLKEHAGAWLGPLAPVVHEVRFEDGLLVECALRPKGAKTPLAQGDVRWATVETLRCPTGKIDAHEVVLHPVMRSLRHLVDPAPSLVEVLLRDPTPRRIETITQARGVRPRALRPS